MHRFDDEARTVAGLVSAYVTDRLSREAPLGATATREQLAAALGSTITEDGLGAAEAFHRFAGVIAPATIGLDSPRFLAFIPAAPSVVAAQFDAVVSACSFSAESWLEAAGAVHAENEVLRFLADLAGQPAGAGGCFVSGGSAGNLSALVAARDRAPDRPYVAVADTAHSSVDNALGFLGLRAVVVPTGDDGRFTAGALDAALADGPEVAWWWRPPARPTPAWWMTWPDWPRSPTTTVPGSTSTARTGSPRSSRPPHGRCSRASRRPTP
jgi:hypothetical protein